MCVRLKRRAKANFDLPGPGAAAFLLFSLSIYSYTPQIKEMNMNSTH